MNGRSPIEKNQGRGRFTVHSAPDVTEKMNVMLQPEKIAAMSKRILIVDDEPQIGEVVSAYLRQESFDTVVKGTVASAMAEIEQQRPDLMLLDITLPDGSGLDVLRRGAEGRRIPTIMLTARSEEIDRIVGFELGADDYICKPFSPREVVARVKAVMRRTGQVYDQRPTVMNFGRLEIDEAAREVRIDGEDIRLKPREFSLLLTLATNPGVALSRRMLLERVWGFDFDGDERTVDVHIRRVRYKLEEERDLPPMLQTVHGFGYKFSRS
jgi:two-component system response regulator ResD